MKKTIKKLILNRETVRQLSRASLEVAVGAKLAPPPSIQNCTVGLTDCPSDVCPSAHCGGGGSGAATSCVITCLIC